MTRFSFFPLIFRLQTAAYPAGICDEARFAWMRDPLSHPDLAAMDERMLADLPFPSLRRICDPATK